MDRNLESIKTMDGTNVLADSTFSYDGNANRTEKKGLEGLTRYSYDANNRLIEVQYPHILGNLKDGNTAFEKLSYDKAGNRTLRVTESLTEQYHYDNCNRLTRLDTTPTDLSKPQTIRFYRYDKQGNMLSDGANTYSYDGFNRVAEVRTEEGSIQKNRYDADGLRHEMEENGQLVKFLYNENREVEVEEESNGNIIRYIRGLGIISSDSESARTYYHYVSDEQGSVTQVLEGESGTVLNRYTYDAFGNTIECAEQVHNRFRYNGEQYDPVTSQYYLRARFYNSAIARFTQEDTYYGDGLNLYQYCANNPVVYQDPSGHNICQTQRDVYHDKCEAYMKEHGLDDYSQIPKDQKKRMYDEMRTELGLKKSTSNDPHVYDSDIEAYRRELGNPTNELGNPLDTVAVGKTNIPGLEDQVFKGASPEVRKAAGLGDLNDAYPDRSIKSPYDNPAFVKHAEEGVIAEFERAIKNAGLDPATVKGDLYIRQSFGDGVCNKCTAGLLKPSPSGNVGIFKQLSNMYPNLNIYVSTYGKAIPGESHGLLSFDIVEQNVTNVVKK